MRLAGKPLAVIPTLGVSPWLLQLRENLTAAGVTVRMVVNSPGLSPHRANGNRSGVHTQIAPGQSIYRTWNEAMDVAKRRGSPLLILNDDIELTVESIRLMLHELRMNDQWTVLGFDYLDSVHLTIESTSVTFRQGGLGGFAFAVDPMTCPKVDERFKWWYGDDDLVRRCIKQSLRVGILRGCPVIHHSSWSMNSFPHLLPEGWEHDDRELYAELWQWLA